MSETQTEFLSEREEEREEIIASLQDEEEKKNQISIEAEEYSSASIEIWFFFSSSSWRDAIISSLSSSRSDKNSVCVSDKLSNEFKDSIIS